VKPASWVWLDDGLVPWDEANVHVLTHALNHGTGVFEGIRCYETERGPGLFRLRDHVDRLGRSGAAVLIDVPLPSAALCEATAQVVAANGFRACYVRMLAYRAYGEMGINCDLSPVSIAIAAWAQAPSFPPEKYDRGLRATISSWRRVDANAISPKAKIIGAYVGPSVARAEAVRAGFDEAIMLSATGNVAEATIQNLFAVLDGRLVTPPLSDGPLPGITRATVLELARDLGLEAAEESLMRSDLYAADEVFLTGTGAEIVPVREIDGRRIGDPGDVTRTIQETYAAVARGRVERYAEWVYPVEAAVPAAAAAREA
jgi:branched-chain amino acid aminotransferase